MILDLCHAGELNQWVQQTGLLKQSPSQVQGWKQIDSVQKKQIIDFLEVFLQSFFLNFCQPNLVSSSHSKL